jgi:hypothetical protein
MSADIKREGVSNMNKKLNLLVMLVCLLALSLVFGSCDNGTTDNGGGGGGTDGDKTFTLTGITDVQKLQGQTFAFLDYFRKEQPRQL